VKSALQDEGSISTPVSSQQKGFPTGLE
jgi:hypothetical protein